MERRCTGRCLAGLGALALLAGCATAPRPQPRPQPVGSAAYQALPGNAKTRRYVIGPSQKAKGAGIERFSNPVYPQALLTFRLPPVDIVVRLVIDRDGRVQRVLPYPPSQLETIPHGAAFMAAIEGCTAQWQYSPLTITQVTMVGGKATRSTQTLPFSLDYAFHFEVHDGKPRTGLSRQ